MSTCTACAHSERAAIESDLRALEKPDWRALRQKYGVHHLALMRHRREHMKPDALTEMSLSQVVESVDTELTLVDEVGEPASMTIYNMPQVTENPMRQFTRAIDTVAEAYQLAHDDPRMQAHMRERLQEKIKLMVQAEDMGI
jgi:hypothetical protein